MPQSQTTPTSGYVHGSDLILGVQIADIFTPLGYAKTCEINNDAETKDRSHKNIANTGKWKNKIVTGLKVSISSEGFTVYDDDNLGSDELYAMWESGESVALRYCHRGEEAKRYREGNFIITSLKESAPSDDDATWSISFENDGPVITVEVPPVA